jgi:soluble lytic murein transglycosylase-like protein
VLGAKGLMQFMPKMHVEAVEEHGGEQAVLDPATNILIGARILKGYIRRTGSLETGLQYYNGALSEGSTQYVQKVIAEQERLRKAIGHRDQ